MIDKLTTRDSRVCIAYAMADLTKPKRSGASFQKIGIGTMLYIFVFASDFSENRFPLFGPML
ncbi:MAG TPA: hypothetical protein DDW73_04165 [Rhizobium sp.]|jgi:hypothetical protein|nr:hypothetical protein [Rhizobium sp.]